MPGHDTREAGPSSFSQWSELVSRRTVVMRGIKFAVVVGTVLIAINHGDAILAGELTSTHYVKMGLTVIVPYVVSVFSSCGALIESGAYRPSTPTGDESTSGAR